MFTFSSSIHLTERKARMGKEWESVRWVVGYTAAELNGPPASVLYYKDIREAYKKATEHVKEHPDNGFCSIGPDSTLKCWELRKDCKAKFKKTSENIVLCYHPKELNLDENAKPDIEESETDEWTYTYLHY